MIILGLNHGEINSSAAIIKNGEILDDRINQYQKRLNDN